ncbi:MAG: ammonium transporter [Actinobacteria bacterium]|nr:ammonium transporter [Actinomycetota bacterium]
MNNVSAGDTAFMLIATALVMFMTPGLALFYGGMVRSKNALGTIMQSFVALGIVTVLWILFGYSLAFGPDKFHLIGGLKYLGLNGVGAAPNADLAATIPQTVFMAYQLMFAIITPALISGAFAERMKFKGYLLFIALWTIVVYFPVAHWVWAPGGWIRNLGALDFAGGTVVHINAGIAALAAALYIGKRKGFGKEAHVPHNVPMTVLGAAMLWFGWFGFNAGSALSAGSLAASAFVATQVAAATATLGWVIAEWAKAGKPTTLGAATGAVAGLVAITPAAGFVGPLGAAVIGLLAGAICYFAVGLKYRFGYDDSLDVVGCHLVGGIVGSLATGIFASKVINPAGANGLLFGNPSLFLIQFIAVAVTMGFGFIVTLALLKVTDVLVGLRVSEEEEETGLDLSQHSEGAYALGFGEMTMASTGAVSRPVDEALKTHAAILAEAAEKMAAAAEKMSTSDKSA